MKIKNILLTLCTSLLLTNVAAHAKEVKIGMKVFVQSANGNEETQMSQIENMINRGVDVLVIIPYNGQVLSNVVKEAKQEGIKVLAYDRMINDADIDFYISFDNEKVGELQAKALVDIVPQGNYFLMGGSPVDNNAKLFRAGQMKVLKPYVDSGKIKVVGDQWVDGWLPENALKIMENALTANNNKIDAVVASNDATAGGAIQALSAQGLSGKVAISGQDADLAGIKRIAAGTQTMTVYKPITLLANTAAEIAVELGNGQEPKADTTLNNGLKDVPSRLLTPIDVNKNNIKDPGKPTEINTLLLTIPVDRRIMSKGQNKSDTIRTTIRFSDLSWQNRVVNTQCLI